MKTFFGRASLALLLVAYKCLVLGNTTILERGPDHRVRAVLKTVEDASGAKMTVTNSYTELETGMHYWEKGKWVESEELIELRPQGGAVAKRGRHKVEFAANINSEGAVEVTSPDGQKFRSWILGLSYWDTASGETVLFAELQDSVGEVLGNHVLYQNAFTDVKADVRYIYTKAGMEQDIILRQQPPSPEAYGLNPATTKIQVVTEFFNPPQPKSKARQTRNGHASDESINFGAMRIGPGKAFTVGKTQPRVHVEKSWTVIQNRQFLFEEISLSAVANDLADLPPAEVVHKGPPQGVRHVVSRDRLLPKRKIAAVKSGEKMQVAKASSPTPGFVIDYPMILVSATNFTFQGDRTYYVTNDVYLSGTTVIEGGAVVKGAVDSVLVFEGPIDCQTDIYRPALFISKDDNSAGETIAGSTGSPSGYYWYSPFYLLTGPQTLKHLRIANANCAISCEMPGVDTTISHVQILNCSIGVNVYDAETHIRNGLIANSIAALTAYDASTVTLEHLTAVDLHYLTYAFSTNCVLRATNSLLVSVTNLSNSTNIYTNHVHSTSDTNTFQFVGAGKYYLANISAYRDCGTTNLSVGLLGDLGRRTTYPPIVLSNRTFSTNITLSPQADRDNDVPDLGYHYDPLDFLVFNVKAANSTLALTNGVAVGWYRYRGLSGKVVSTGRPGELNWIVHHNTVQEQRNLAEPFTAGGGFHTVGGSGPSTFQFSGFSCMAADHFHVVGASSDGPVELHNSQIFGGWLTSKQPPLALTNALLFRCGLSFEMDIAMQNCTLIGGDYWAPEGITLAFKDNLSVGTTFSIGEATLDAGHNAYLSGHSRFDPTDVTDIILTNSFFPFTNGPLGNFYQGITNLVNQGSQSVSNAGLFHFTSQSTYIKDTGVVDIGFHYVATTNGVPIDTDSDGLPDYFEDVNGNGDGDTGESDWETADTDGDGVNDYIEWLQGRDPTVNGTTSNSPDTINLRVFTPLE